MTKAEQARGLAAHAKELAASLERNPLQIAAIAYKFEQDRDLLTELGFGSIAEWGKATFGKRWKSVENWKRVYAKLFLDGNYNVDTIYEIGTVKANLLARLPESEIRKEDWQKSARELSTADFKKKIKAFLEDRPDHKEQYGRVSFDAPKSFISEAWKPTIKEGMAHEGTEETYVVVEAALANYMQELQNAELAEEAGEDAEAAQENQDPNEDVSVSPGD